MKQLFTLIFAVGCLSASAQTFDTTTVAVKPVSSFSSESLKKSKVERRAQRYAQSRFIPSDKYIGANFSFGSEEIDDELLISSIDVPKFRRNIFAVSLVFGYFTSPISAWGGRVMYNYGYNDVEVETDLFGFLPEERQYRFNSLMHRGEVYGFHRLYVPLGDKGKNFYFFNEVSVHYGYQRSTTTTSVHDSEGERSHKNAYNTTHRFGVGIAPGLTYFSGNRMAIEFQLGTSGLEVALRNAVSDTGRDSHSVGFVFRDFMSILRIKMGLTFYFN